MSKVSLMLLVAPWLLALCTGRSGLNGGSTHPFALTVPISRSRLVQTRFLANSAALAVMLLLIVILAGTWFQWQRHSVPWGAILFSTTIGWMTRIPFLAAADALNAMFEPVWVQFVIGIILFLPYLVIHVQLMHHELNLFTDPALLRTFLLGSVLTSVALVALSDWGYRQKEY